MNVRYAVTGYDDKLKTINNRQMCHLTPLHFENDNVQEPELIQNIFTLLASLAIFNREDWWKKEGQYVKQR